MCYNCPDCSFFSSPQFEVHEIHVTVRTDDPEAFFKICEEHDIKAIVIEDFRGNYEIMTHIMTSQKVKGSEEDARKELKRITDVLSDFHIIREKIETNLLIKRDYSKGYFESHLEFDVQDMSWFRQVLQILDEGIMISRNKKKNSIVMATIREHNSSPEKFQRRLSRVIDKFLAHGYKSKKVITEYCYLDTNLNMDKGW